MKKQLLPSSNHKYFFVKQGIFYEKLSNSTDKRLFDVKFNFNVDKIVNIDLYNRAFQQGLFDLKVGDIVYLNGFNELAHQVIFLKKNGLIILKLNCKKNKYYLDYKGFGFTDILSIIEKYSK